MNTNRRFRLRTIWVVLCALLLAQWSLAAHACPTIQSAGPSHAAAMASDCDCADEGDAPSTLCYKHCNSDEQASGGAAIAFAAPPPALIIARTADAFPIEPAAATPGLAHATAPPFTILYCVSLT